MRAVRTTIISILAIGLLAGSAVGVAAQSAIVTGSISSGDDCETTPEGAESCTGGRFEFDDPRLTGDYDYTHTVVFGPEGAFIATEDFRLTNDEGAWSGHYVMGSFFLEGDESDAPPEGEIDPVAHSVGPVGGDELVSGGNNWVLTGEGADEGLTAWVYSPPIDGARTQGIILEAEPME